MVEKNWFFGVLSCPEEMERALRGRDREQDVAWDEARAEVAWAARLPPVPAAVAFVPVVDTGRNTRQDSRAIRRSVPSAAAL